MGEGKKIKIINEFIENKFKYYEIFLKGIEYKSEYNENELDKILRQALIDSFGNEIEILIKKQIKKKNNN